MPPVARAEKDVCLAGNTKISLLSGESIAIEKLVGKKDFYVYAVDRNTNKFVPARVEKVWKTRINTPTMKVILDNDEELRCTLDHEFMLRNGHMIEARNLKSGMSMMPLYTKIEGATWTAKGYEQIKHPNGEYEPTHRMVYKWKYSNPTGNKVAHHKDFNSLNNDPRNILKIDKKEHFRYHSRHAKKWREIEIKEGRLAWQNPKNIEKTRKRMKESNPMFLDRIKENKSRIESEKMKNGTHHFLNLSDDSKKKQSENMVKVRQSHPLGYHQGKNPFSTQEVIEVVKERMTKKNPMKDPEVKKRMADRKAKKIGFISDEEAVKVIKWFSDHVGLSAYKIAKLLGVDKDYVNLRLAEDYNHKIKEVIFDYKRIDVYDLTVDKHHNFALSCGIVSSNCTGHGCFPSRKIARGSPNVFVNSKPVQRRNVDSFHAHCCGSSCHSAVTSEGSSKVFVNGIPVTRIGDSVSCGGSVKTGSPNVAAGG